jgi:Cupin superfamily protein
MQVLEEARENAGTSIPLTTPVLQHEVDANGVYWTGDVSWPPQPGPRPSPLWAELPKSVPLLSKSALTADELATLPLPKPLAVHLPRLGTFERHTSAVTALASYRAHRRTRAYDLGLLETGVRASVYVSRPGDEGLGMHFDHHATVVIQLGGAKAWRFLEAPGVVTEPGDVLVIPAGLVHEAGAAPGSGFSRHLALRYIRRERDRVRN